VLAESADLSNSQQDVHPGTIYEWTRAHVLKNADAVFIGGNGFRAVGAIEALEEDLGRPVLTGRRPPSTERRPGLVLMDIRLPGIDGIRHDLSVLKRNVAT
jgi:CheY-like chemotaxis protein